MNGRAEAPQPDSKFSFNSKEMLKEEQSYEVWQSRIIVTCFGHSYLSPNQFLGFESQQKVDPAQVSSLLCIVR